jgi:putative dimethyl sulfoxide reductase chaperone
MTVGGRPVTEVERIVALRLLSLALRPATDEMLDEVAALGEALAGNGAPIPAIGELWYAATGTDAEEIAAQQERLFGGQVAVPPYEGSYESDPFRQARQLADVAGFYRAFGAEAHGPASDRPDHAGAQLEFLAFVAARRVEAQAAGRPDEAEACADAERLFVAEHAGRWLPVFFASVTATADDPFHLALGVVGEAIVRDLARSHDVVVERVRSRAARLPVEADDLTCAAGDEAVLPGLT